MLGPYCNHEVMRKDPKETMHQHFVSLQLHASPCNEHWTACLHPPGMGMYLKGILRKMLAYHMQAACSNCFLMSPRAAATSDGCGL